MIRKEIFFCNTYCMHCQCFRDGSYEPTVTSGRKLYYNFNCSWCFLTTDGFVVKKDYKKLNP